MNPSGNIAEYAISEDGTRVVYLADQVTDSVFELFGVPIDGSSPAVRLNGPLVDGGDVQRGVEVRDDGRSVFYLADQRIDGAIELFATFETRTLPHAGPTRTAERTQ